MLGLAVVAIGAGAVQAVEGALEDGGEKRADDGCEEDHSQDGIQGHEQFAASGNGAIDGAVTRDNEGGVQTGIDPSESFQITKAHRACDQCDPVNQNGTAQKEGDPIEETETLRFDVAGGFQHGFLLPCIDRTGRILSSLCDFQGYDFTFFPFWQDQ